MCIECAVNSGPSCNGCTKSTDCTCNAGYNGLDGGSCTTCSTGTYKNTTASQSSDPLTSILAVSPAYLVTSGEAWDSVNSRFTDLSGNSRHGLLTAGTVTVGGVIGNGSNWSIPFVEGTTTTKILWGVSSTPATFTICSITRYPVPPSSFYGKILYCTDKSAWWHGQWKDAQGTYAGSIYYGVGNAGIPSALRYAISPVTNWVVTCGRNIGTSGATYSIVNGVVTSTFISTGNNGGNGNCQLAINNNLASAFSDWQLSRLYVWDTDLSEEVFAQASAKLNSYLSNSGETSRCLVCPAAYYISTDSTATTSCPANSVSPVSSSSQANCTCNAGYFGPTGGTCTPCTDGQYKNTLGNTQCQDNPAWLVGPGQGCSYFAPGRPYDGLCVPMAGTGTCSNCCASCGHVCPGGGSGISTGLCTSCAAGTYSSTQGASSCTPCATGKYSATAAATCLVCHTNSTSPEGSTRRRPLQTPS